LRRRAGFRHGLRVWGMSAIQQISAAAPDVAAAFTSSAAPTPSATAAPSVGATAYTEGSQMAFSPSPSLATPAHEVAHIQQQSAALFEGMY
jgi:hypothetical protein